MSQDEFPAPIEDLTIKDLNLSRADRRRKPEDYRKANICKRDVYKSVNSKNHSHIGDKQFKKKLSSLSNSQITRLLELLNYQYENLGEDALPKPRLKNRIDMISKNIQERKNDNE